MSDVYQPSLDLTAAIESPRERGERLAKEMLDKAMQERANNPENIELASADNQAMYTMPLVEVEHIEEHASDAELGEVYTPQQVFDLAKSLRDKNNAQRLDKGLPPISSKTIAENTRLGATQYLNNLGK